MEAGRSPWRRRGAGLLPACRAPSALAVPHFPERLLELTIYFENERRAVLPRWAETGEKSRREVGAEAAPTHPGEQRPLNRRIPDD